MAVDPDIQHPELLAQLFGVGAGLLLRNLPLVFAGKGPSRATPQDEAQVVHAAKVGLVIPGGTALGGLRPWTSHGLISAPYTTLLRILNPAFHALPPVLPFRHISCLTSMPCHSCPRRAHAARAGVARLLGN